MSPRPDEDAATRFERSMAIDRDKWRDGIGYDVAAIDDASPAERARIEDLVLRRGASNWRDVEALARLDTSRTREALREAFLRGSHRVRLAVVRQAPSLVSEDERVASLVDALEHAVVYEGLTQALDEAASFHPPAVLDALFRGALRRRDEAAVQFAALLAFLHGAADEPFDMEQRPFFLRFATTRREAREQAFRELCARIDVAPEPWLGER